MGNGRANGSRVVSHAVAFGTKLGDVAVDRKLQVGAYRRQAVINSQGPPARVLYACGILPLNLPAASRKCCGADLRCGTRCTWTAGQ